MDPYAVLGVARNASISQIRQAYVAQARRSHPDVRGGSAGAGEEMRRINQAWEMLSDSESRAAVDRRLRAERHQSTTRQSPPKDSAQSRNADRFSGSASATNGFSHDTGDDPSSHFAGDSFTGDDSPLTRAELPAWLALGMPLTFVIGIFGVIVGAMTAAFVLVRLGVLLLIVAAMLFALSPFAVLIRSKTQHRRQRST